MHKDVTILIATDSVYLSNLVAELLSKQGYLICGTVETKHDLVSLYKEFSPTIVILDLSIENQFNFTSNSILDLLNLDEEALLMVIGEDVCDDFKNKILNLGVKEYLCKPFQPAALWERTARISNFFIKQLRNSSIANAIPDENSGKYLNLPKFTHSIKEDSSISEVDSISDYYTYRPPFNESISEEDKDGKNGRKGIFFHNFINLFTKK